jgi:hypothetical protein
MAMAERGAQKYTIAWFKLAECVSRGDKERALGVYRLLSHSLTSDALRAQLQGDIWLSFGELDNAITQYREAAHKYRINNQLVESASLFQHLRFLDPHTPFYKNAAQELYEQLGLPFHE